jgi:hypothetical protein
MVLTEQMVLIDQMVLTEQMALTLHLEFPAAVAKAAVVRLHLLPTRSVGIVIIISGDLSVICRRIRK